MDFNEVVDRRGTHCGQWDAMEKLFGISSADGLAMWVADSNYPTAPCVRAAVQRAVDHGCFGYSYAYPEYLQSIAWWMDTRHGWQIDTDWILTAQGLGNSIALCIDVWSEPGDGVVTFSPVYHEFARKVATAGRSLTECPLKREAETYVLDLEDAQSRLNGSEKILIWCSPQNPSGRIWTADELRAVADFAERNNLLLISDEIHHDLLYPGNTFVPMAVAVPQSIPRLVVTTAPSKTFNIAGQRTGNMIIPDADRRAAMAQRLRTLDYNPSALGLTMIEAAYSPEGAKWVDEQMIHLGENCRIFNEGINAIPGLWSMPLQATFLAWVDFSDTGMSFDEHSARIRDVAKIAVSPGNQFGQGGETFQRFNLAAPRSMIEDAVDRMRRAFGDLQ